MITVLHVITSLGSGGAERMLTKIVSANHGPDAPRQVVVSLMDQGIYGAVLNAAGIEVRCLGMRRRRLSPRALLQLAVLMRRLNPDVVMSWLYHADLMATLAALVAGISMKRLVWNLRCSDIDFARYAQTTRWTVSLLIRLSRLPAAIAVNSDAGRRAHVALGYRPNRWIYIPNGFDLEEWRPDPVDRALVRSELGFKDQTVAMGMVARADPQKDHPTLLAAAERLVTSYQHVEFVLIGKDTEYIPLPESLRERIHPLGQRGDVPKLLRGLDILVLSSAYGEGFPNVVGEAMATGLPCVVTDVGDSAHLVGETGWVVPPRSPDALAQAISELLAESSGVRAKRGEMARHWIQANYSIDRVKALYRETWLCIASSAATSTRRSG